ncbi:hypothetical protein IV77_GL000821 [Olsenella uli DSM 7084]|nr:hypothetical protein IV77_GL000821 [Olsenella uli DSM 7084]
MAPPLLSSRDSMYCLPPRPPAWTWRKCPKKPRSRRTRASVARLARSMRFSSPSSLKAPPSVCRIVKLGL